ncbi:hypothetical protein ACHAXT_006916 [Thalassiosira profunda]
MPPLVGADENDEYDYADDLFRRTGRTAAHSPRPRRASLSAASTNPLSHLRDYGALRVFAKATCPICLEECEPVVALRCGHCVCEDDHSKLGGCLASDRKKLETKKASALAPSASSAPASSASAAAPSDRTGAASACAVASRA